MCDKVVCERQCVTKLCVKESACVCDEVVCERECVTKLCVTKLCVKDGV